MEPNLITKLTYSIAEACKVLGIGRTTLYALRKAGQITFLKIGGRTVVHRDELVRFGACLPEFT